MNVMQILFITKKKDKGNLNPLFPPYEGGLIGKLDSIFLIDRINKCKRLKKLQAKPEVL